MRTNSHSTAHLSSRMRFLPSNYCKLARSMHGFKCSVFWSSYCGVLRLEQRRWRTFPKLTAQPGSSTAGTGSAHPTSDHLRTPGSGSMREFDWVFSAQHWSWVHRFRRSSFRSRLPKRGLHARRIIITATRMASAFIAPRARAALHQERRHAAAMERTASACTGEVRAAGTAAWQAGSKRGQGG